MADRQLRKRAVNLSVDAELIDEARRLEISLSESFETDLRARVKLEREKRWIEENAAAISSINTFIEQHGLLAAKLRYRPD